MTTNKDANMQEAMENFVCDIMTAYRWIPLLATIIDDDTSDERRGLAWRQLSDKMVANIGSTAGSKEEFEILLRNFVSNNEAWILYSLADMARYVSMHFFPHSKDARYERIRFDNYAGRMDGQQRFIVWNEEAFVLPHSTSAKYILDIGCGTFPFFSLFNDNNHMIEQYLGVDKRSMVRYIEKNPGEFDPRVVSFVQLDILLCDKVALRADMNDELTTIFMGEFLHCLADPYVFIHELLEAFPTVQEICILEISPGNANGLGQCFEFHMQAHGSGNMFQLCDMPKIAEELGLKLKIRPVSSQHTMYILVK